MKTKRVPLFQQLGYILTTIGLNRVAAALRYVACRITGLRGATIPVTLTFGGKAVYLFEAPYDTRTGYTGYIKHPRLGVLAFRRLDGTIQYRW